jgi:hypothetical protein
MSFAADIDWDNWITARLKRAAARRTSSHSVDTALQRQQGLNSLRQHLPMRQASVSLRTPNHSKAVSSQKHSKSAGNSRRSSAPDDGQQAGMQAQDPARAWQVGSTPSTVHFEFTGPLITIADKASCHSCVYRHQGCNLTERVVLSRRHRTSPTQACARLTHSGPSWSGCTPAVVLNNRSGTHGCFKHLLFVVDCSLATSGSGVLTTYVCTWEVCFESFLPLASLQTARQHFCMRWFAQHINIF